MSKTIFEKIQDIRVELRNSNLRMTGHNKFADYDYFELEDFLPTLSVLMQKHGITAIPSFTKELATLTAYNCDDPFDKVEITSPFGSAALKGCHEVQSIGAVETYQRRYLYQALFDIGEKDCLNATINNPKNDKVGTEQKGEDVKISLTTETDDYFPPFASYISEQEVLDMVGSVRTVEWIRQTYKVKYLSDLTKDQAEEIKRKIKEQLNK